MVEWCLLFKKKVHQSSSHHFQKSSLELPNEMTKQELLQQEFLQQELLQQVLLQQELVQKELRQQEFLQ